MFAYMFATDKKSSTYIDIFVVFIPKSIIYSVKVIAVLNSHGS